MRAPTAWANRSARAGSFSLVTCCAARSESNGVRPLPFGDYIVGCEHRPHLIIAAFGVQKLIPGQHDYLLQQDHFETKHPPVQIGDPGFGFTCRCHTHLVRTFAPFGTREPEPYAPPRDPVHVSARSFAPPVRIGPPRSELAAEPPKGLAIHRAGKPAAASCVPTRMQIAEHRNGQRTRVATPGRSSPPSHFPGHAMRPHRTALSAWHHRK